MSQFWVVGVPAAQQDIIASRNKFLDAVAQTTESKPFAIPNFLQVGTIDKLISLSDELGRVDPQLGGLCRKIKRTYDEITIAEPAINLDAYTKQQLELKSTKNKSKIEPQPLPLYVSPGTTFDTGDSKGALPKDFLQNFRWSDITYGSTTNVEKIKNEILSQFARTEDELRQSIVAYNEAKNNIQNYEKKVNGNLLVRPIAQFIDPKQIHFTQHLTTLVIAVPRAKEEEFLAQYETIEFKYFEKLRLEEEKRLAQEAKDKAIKEEKEALLGKKSAAEASPKQPQSTSSTTIQPKPDNDAEEEEAEKPPSDEEIQAAQLKEKELADAKAKGQEVVQIVLKPHEQYGLTTDDKYKFVPTVVPGSAMKLVGAEQLPNDDLTLFRVVCFKRYTEDETKQRTKLQELIQDGQQLTQQQQNQFLSSANVEKFKSICRDYRWTIRPFVYDPHEQEVLKQEIQTYVDTRRSEWERLKTFCEEIFDSAFRAWIHIIAMRAFVEIRLRYGLGDNWLSFVVCPKKNSDKKARDILAKIYTEKGTEAMIGVAEDGEYYPYVSVTVDLSDML